MTEYVRIAVEDIIIKKDDWKQYCWDYDTNNQTFLEFLIEIQNNNLDPTQKENPTQKNFLDLEIKEIKK